MRKMHICGLVLLLLFCLLAATGLYAETESPVHGVYWWYDSYTDWNNSGRPVFEAGNPDTYLNPEEFFFDGSVYLGFQHSVMATNDLLQPTDGYGWRIVFFEKIGNNRVIYHLAPINENGAGIVTIVFVDEDTIYFESYEGDEDFIQNIRAFRFGQEYLLRRVRVEP